MTNLDANLTLTTAQFERALKSAENLVDALFRRLQGGLVLDIETNADQAARLATRAIESIDTDVMIDVAADASKFESEAQSAIRSVEGEEVEASFTGNTSDFEAKVETAVRAANGQFVSIPVDADTSLFEGAVGDLVNPATLAGGAAGLIFGAAFADSLDLDAGLGRAEGRLALTAAESAAFGEAAGALYADAYGESVGSQIDLLTELARFDLVATADVSDLERGGARVQDFANTFSLDAIPSIEAVQQLVESGLSDNLGQGLDQLTSLLQQSKVPGDELLDTVKEYSPFLAEAGISFDTFATTAITGGASTAIELDKLGDSIKEATIRIDELTPDNIMELATVSGLSTEAVNGLVQSFQAGDPTAFQDIVGVLQSIEDPADRAAFSMLIFGTQGEDAARILAEADFTTPFESIEGATEAAGEAVNSNLTTAFTSLLRTALQPVSDVLTSSVLPALTQVVGTTTSFLTESGLLEPILIGVGVALAAIVVAAAPISGTFLLIAGAIAGLVALFGFFRDELSGLGPAFEIVRGAVSDFIGSLDFSGVIEVVDGLATSIGEALGRIDFEAIAENFASVLEFITPVAQFFADELGPILQEFGDIFVGLIDLVSGLLEGDWSKAWDGASSIVTSTLALIVRRVTLFPRLILRLLGGLGGGIARSVGGAFAGLGGVIGRSLGSALGAITNWIGSALGAVVSFGADFISAIVGGLASFGGAIARQITTDPITNWIAEALGAVVSFGVDFVSAVVGGLAGLAVAIGTPLVNAIGAINAWVASALSTVLTFGLDFVTAIAGGLTGVGLAIGSALLDGVTAINTWVTTALTAVVTFGLDFVTAIAGGLTGVGLAIGGALLDGITVINTWVTTALTAVVTFGVDFVTAIAGGLTGVGLAIGGALLDGITAITTWVTTALATVVTFGVDFVTAIAAGLAGLAVAIATPLLDATTAIVTWVTSSLAAIVTWGVDFVASAVGGLAGLAVQVATILGETLASIVGWIAEAIGVAVTFGTDFIATVAGGLAGLWAGISGAFIDTLANVVAWVGNVLASVASLGADVISSIAGGLASLWATISTFFTEALNGITTWVGSTLAAVATVGADIIRVIAGGLAALWATISVFFAEALNGVIGWVGDFLGSVATLGADFIRIIVGGLTGLAGAVGRILGEALSSVTGWVDSVIGALEGAASTIQGIWDRISGILSSALPSISIPSVNLPFFAKGGINERGQVGLLEGYAREVAIPLEGRYGTDARKIDLLRKSGLYDLVTADLARPNYATYGGTVDKSRSFINHHYYQKVIVKNGTGKDRRTARLIARELSRI